jgi:hypothetical protein
LLHAFKLIVVALIGLGLGLGATYHAVERGQDRGLGVGLIFGAVKAGPWSGWPKTGTRESDPYARALFARNGETPIGLTEGLSFLARADSHARPFDSACDYAVQGAIPAARFWTLSALSPQGRTLPAISERHGFTSSEILRDADGGFEIKVSASARPGDWLEIAQGQPFVLMLRLYDTALSANPYSVTAGVMPAIAREGCR